MSGSERPLGCRIQSRLTIGAGPIGARKTRRSVAHELPVHAVVATPKMDPLPWMLPSMSFVEFKGDLAEPVCGPVRHLDDVGPTLQLACLKDSRLPAPLLILQHRLAAEGEHAAVENRQVGTGRPWDLIAFRKLVDRVLPADKVEKVQDGRRLSEPWRRAVAVRPGTAMFHASKTVARPGATGKCGSACRFGLS